MTVWHLDSGLIRYTHAGVACLLRDIAERPPQLLLMMTFSCSSRAIASSEKNCNVHVFGRHHGLQKTALWGPQYSIVKHHHSRLVLPVARFVCVSALAAQEKKGWRSHITKG